MKLKPWNIADEIKTKGDLLAYLKAGLEENDFKFAILSCEDFLDIARKKGWLK